MFPTFLLTLEVMRSVILFKRGSIADKEVSGAGGWHRGRWCIAGGAVSSALMAGMPWGSTGQAACRGLATPACGRLVFRLHAGLQPLAGLEAGEQPAAGASGLP